MSDTISILGLSKTSIAVIIDLIKETLGDIGVQVYLNQDPTVEPEFPVKEIPYKTVHFSKVSNIQPPVFFGTASALTRLKIYNFFDENYEIQMDKYLSIIHPSAYSSDTIKLDAGILIEPLSIISSQSQIGFATFIKRGASIGHHNEIGAFCDINPGATLSGNVKVGEGTIIGTGAIVRDNINIGCNTVIGAGSVVISDMPDNVIAYGNPCKVKRNNLQL